MTTTLKVNEDTDTCVDCVLCENNGFNDATCGVSDRIVPQMRQPVPTWCPLKSGDVVVRLVRKGGA